MKDWTEAELAQHLRKSTSTLGQWRRRGYGPAFRKVGASVVYPDASVQAFLDSQIRAPGRVVGTLLTPSIHGAAA